MFKKGIIKPPFLLHFRIATAGGVSKELTHPFPIEPTASLALEGECESVLMHNGHFSEWQKVLLNNISPTYKFPEGDWSDSRAMAFIASIHGEHVLKLFEEKITVLSAKTGLTIFEDKRFVTHTQKDGSKLFLSNSINCQYGPSGYNNNTTIIRSTKGSYTSYNDYIEEKLGKYPKGSYAEYKQMYGYYDWDDVEDDVDANWYWEDEREEQGVWVSKAVKEQEEINTLLIETAKNWDRKEAIFTDEDLERAIEEEELDHWGIYAG
jgi:predicted glutamine amidotransferase